MSVIYMRCVGCDDLLPWEIVSEGGRRCWPCRKRIVAAVVAKAAAEYHERFARAASRPVTKAQEPEPR